MTFHQDDPNKSYKQSVPSASRLEHKTAACDTIGTIVFDDGRTIADSDVAAIADKVASVGGTHYVIRDSTTHTRRGEKHAPRVVEVLVCTSGIREDD